MNSLLLVASALCHFSLIEPKGRKVDESTSMNAPCGGSPPMERITLPMTGNYIGTRIYHKNSTIFYRISMAENPTTQEEFSELLPTLVVERAGTIRTPPIDFSTVKVNAGSKATIQVQSLDSHEIMYQCIDVVFEQKQASSSSAVTLGSAFGLLLVGLLI
jgi:hypothetical protein